MTGKEKGVIRAVIVHLARGLLRDGGCVGSDITRSYRLFELYGVPLDSFLGCVKIARSATLRALPRLKRPGGYFFTVLENSLEEATVKGRGLASDEASWLVELASWDCRGVGSPKDAGRAEGASYGQ